MNDLDLPQNGQPTFSQEDLVGLGGMLASTGFTTLEARAFVNMVIQLSTRTILGSTPELLEQVRRIHSSRLAGIVQRVRQLPNMGGYVNRERVIQIVQDVYSTSPRG